MRRAGRRSWRCTIGDSAPLGLALWVRDATGIVTAPVDAPPPLAVTPARSAVLDGQDLVAVGRDWLDWWRSLVAWEVAARLDPSRPERVERGSRPRVSDTPPMAPDDGFAALACMPVLQQAVRALFLPAHRGLDRTSAQQERPWASIAAVVAEVAARRGVDPGVLDGNVVLLPVAGPWWHLAAPGVALASVQAWLDPVSGDEVLRMVLESPLDAGVAG